MTLNHIEQWLILASATTGCVSISAFTLLNGIPVDIASSALASYIFFFIAWIKKYKSIIKKKREINDKIKVNVKI